MALCCFGVPRRLVWHARCVADRLPRPHRAFACAECSLAQHQQHLQSCMQLTRGLSHDLEDLCVQAEAFQSGLALNPADRMLSQGYWDCMNLISQCRSSAPAEAGA